MKATIEIMMLNSNDIITTSDVNTCPAKSEDVCLSRQ